MTRILIVDDEPDVELIIRQKFRRHIREKQWEFEFAHNGQEALDKVGELPDIEIMLTDINMPVMDGLTLLKEVRGMDRQLTSVVVSAYGDMSNIRRAMNEGAIDFVTKPIDLTDLEMTINKSVEVVRQLREARQSRLDKLEAQAANRAKSKFLADMSHELRTPLNAIILYSELIMEEAGDLGALEVVPDLRKINTAGKHLLTLINDILDFSKIEAGKMKLQVEDFEVRSLVTEVYDILRSAFTKNGNALELFMADDVGSMHSDPTRVRQCLFNLLSNAAKFTKNGTVTLRVSRDADAMVFEIKDTGIGMTEDEMVRLFQPFTQAEADTSRKYGGTGLGLTITRRCCELMGGTVDVASTAGEGSIFTVRLPLTVTLPGPEA